MNLPPMPNIDDKEKWPTGMQAEDWWSYFEEEATGALARLKALAEAYRERDEADVEDELPRDAHYERLIAAQEKLCAVLDQLRKEGLLK